MSWFTRKGQRVWGEGGLAVALTRHGWTPEDTTPDDGEPEDGPTLTVEHQAHADLTETELADVDQALADEGPSSTWDLS